MITRATFAVALVHFVGRASLIASALLALEGEYRLSIALVGLVSVAFLAERALASLERAEVEARLHQRALDVVFDHPTSASGASQQAILLNGISETSRLVAEVNPAAAGDALAAAAVLTIAVSRGLAVQAAGFAVCAGVGVGAVLLGRKSAAAAATRAWATYDAHVHRVWDGLEGAAEIAAAARADAFRARVEAGLHELRRASRALTLEATLLGRAPLVLGIGGGVAAGFALGLVRSTATTPLGVAVLATMLTPFAGLATALSAHLRAAGGKRALAALLAMPRPVHGTKLPESPKRVILRDVSARYGERQAIENVSLEAAAGMTVLRGRNGSGKSTILRLLVGLLEPSAGTLSVGGVASKDLDWARARERIAYLPQRPYFPETSVREAMQFLLGVVDDDVLRDGLERMGGWVVLAEKSPADPLAVQTTELSAGERQRVALARLFCREAELYLLDEPDANLDQAGIDQLTQVLRGLSSDATVIVAAHTRAMLDLADHVVSLELGRIAAE